MASILTQAIETAKPAVLDELAGLPANRRRKRIRAMAREAEVRADSVRGALRSRGEKDETVWRQELAAVEAPYFAAIELFPDEAPMGHDD